MLERKFFMAFVPYGITPPIITPFSDDGSVNYEVLAMMSRRLVDGGVHGLFPLGTTGEFYAVSDDEFVKILTTVKEAVAGRTTRKGRPIQLFAGCNHITTRGVIHLIKLVEQVGGYDAVSVLTPMFISQTQDELYTYYKTIADSTAMPVILYNNKPKTNVTIAPQTVARLARDCSNIVAVKDSTGDMTNAEEYLRLTAGQRDHFNVLMGRDTLIFAARMAVPCLGLVYDPKVESYRQELELPSAGHVERFDAQEAIACADKLMADYDSVLLRLGEKSEALAQAALKNEELLLQLLEQQA